MKNHEKIATVTGRYYAMDRKKKWERTKQTYEALVLGQSKEYAMSAESAIKNAYERGETDEFIQPTVIVDNGKCNKKGECVGGNPVATIDDNDAVVFFNLRSDRARQLTKSFVQKDFNKKNPGSFKRKKKPKKLMFVAMTDFGPDLDSIKVAFPSEDIKNCLPAVLKNTNQLYIAETEKYAHVTYFFNGGFADPINNEKRIMVPSPDVAKYDLKPEMSANQITDKIVNFINNKKYDFILVNFANPDMVGHTGNLTAGIKACECVDKNLGRILASIKKAQGLMLVTADHGNAEEMIDIQSGEVDTQHSSFPVPFIVGDYRSGRPVNYKLADKGILADVAPTLLKLLGQEKPQEMSGQSLVEGH